MNKRRQVTYQVHKVELYQQNPQYWDKLRTWFHEFLDMDGPLPEIIDGTHLIVHVPSKLAPKMMHELRRFRKYDYDIHHAYTTMRYQYRYTEKFTVF